MTWFEYTNKFYKETNPQEVVGRKVFYSEFYTKKRYKLRGVRDQREKCPIIEIDGHGANNSTEYLLVPETREEFEIYKADLLSQIQEIEERITCLDTTGVERLEERGFVLWKLIQQVKDEKDEDKLKKILSDAIN